MWVEVLYRPFWQDRGDIFLRLWYANLSVVAFLMRVAVFEQRICEFVCNFCYISLTSNTIENHIPQPN